MLEVDLIVQPGATALFSAATDRYLMRAVAEGRRAVLRVSELRGRVLSLGRYHVAPGPVREAAVGVTRRVCGGRVRPAGEGFRTVSLVLPHRSALVAEDPHALAPSQALNRFVRGILRACREMGIPAHYPGRDLITVGGSILAMVSIECSAEGSTLLEAHVATSSQLTAIVDLLETVDPNGVVTAELWAPEKVTNLDRCRGRVIAIEEMGAVLCRAYESEFSTTFRQGMLSREEMEAIQTDAGGTAESWVASRRPGVGMDQHAVAPAQVGVLEAYFSVDERDRIGSILLAGDFIANSPAIAALERRLSGCPMESGAIDEIVHQVVDGRTNFILGLGKLDVISRLLAGGGA